MLSSDMNADTVRQIAGHAQLSTTYNCYYYDRALDQEKMDQMCKALSVKKGSGKQAKQRVNSALDFEKLVLIGSQKSGDQK